MARIIAAPDSAPDGAEIVQIRLAAHAGYGKCSSSTKRPDRAPAQLMKEFRIERGRSLRRGQQSNRAEQTDAHEKNRDQRISKAFHREQLPCERVMRTLVFLQERKGI